MTFLVQEFDGDCHARKANWLAMTRSDDTFVNIPLLHLEADHFAGGFVYHHGSGTHRLHDAVLADVLCLGLGQAPDG